MEDGKLAHLRAQERRNIGLGRSKMPSWGRIGSVLVCDFESPQGSSINEKDSFSDEVRTRQGRAFIRNEVEQAATNPAYNNDLSKQAECSHGMVYKVLQ